MPSTIPAEVAATGTRYRLLAWLCAAAAIIYVQRSAMGVTADGIRRDLALTDVEMGWVMSGFYWAYGLAQVPMGYLGQRWGSRVGMLVSMSMTAAMCVLVGCSWHFASILMFWMLAGIATAAVFPCSVQSLSAWFPARQMALPSGLLGSAMSLGGAISTALTGGLLTAAAYWSAESPDSPFAGWFNWRGVFVLYALPGAVWAIWFYSWFRDRPQDHPQVNAAELQEINDQRPLETHSQSAVSVPWKDMLLGRQMILISGQQLFRSAGYAFFATWFPTYLQRVHAVSVGWSGVLTSLPLVGVIAGGTIAGVLSDRILQRTGSRRWSRQYLGAGTQLLCGLTILCAWLFGDVWSVVSCIAAGSVLMAFGGCCAYSVVMENSRPHVAPAYGMMNTAGNIGAALSPLMAGWIASEFGWDIVLLFYMSLFMCSGLCWFGIDPEQHLFQARTPSGD